MINKLSNPSLKSWISVDANSDFPIQNIPFGIFKTATKSARPATIIGDTVIDLQVLAEKGFFSEIAGLPADVFSKSVLNDFIGLGKEITNPVRIKLSELFLDNSSAQNDIKASGALHTSNEVEMLLPVQIGDYTDFYSSIEHATNLGKMFRDPTNALLPNWKHIPVGYHGRSSSIVVSGTNIKRPTGQTLPKGSDTPVFGPSKLLDFELETAYIIGKKSNLGAPITVADAEDHIFGKVVFNDLSARDIQKWEYVPLGPFLGKNFGSVISPWIVTLEALNPFRVAGPVQDDPEVFDYLKYEGVRNFDINLDVFLQPEGEGETCISQSNFKYMYWNMPQQLAHHTVNGCNINPGDMMASGTISGKDEKSYGSLIEMSWGGTKTIKLNGGGERKFALDGDTMIMRGYCKKGDLRIGFGNCKTKVLPAN